MSRSCLMWVCITFAMIVQPVEGREWEDINGNTLTAEFVDFNHDKSEVQLKTEDGRLKFVPLDSLSEKDIQYLERTTNLQKRKSSSNLDKSKSTKSKKKIVTSQHKKKKKQKKQTTDKEIVIHEQEHPADVNEEQTEKENMPLDNETIISDSNDNHQQDEISIRSQEKPLTLEELAERGDVTAQVSLATSYMRQNLPEKALIWAFKAAEQNSPEAQCMIALAYDAGVGVPQDLREALKWYLKAAIQGQAIAQYKLGLACANGIVIEKNLEDAAIWFHKAAKQGHKDAQYYLACAYADGLGISEDPESAVFWFQEAAMQGHNDAQFELGLRFLMGVGTEPNKALGLKWCREAARHGNQDAIDFLLNLE